MPWTALQQLRQPGLRLTGEESHGQGYDDRTGHREADLSHDPTFGANVRRYEESVQTTFEQNRPLASLLGKSVLSSPRIGRRRALVSFRTTASIHAR